MEKIFDIAKDSEQSWGTLATAIDGNFEELDTEVNNIDIQINGRHIVCTGSNSSGYKTLMDEISLKKGKKYTIVATIPGNTSVKYMYLAADDRAENLYVNLTLQSVESSTFYYEPAEDIEGAMLVVYGDISSVAITIDSVGDFEDLNKVENIELSVFGLNGLQSHRGYLDEKGLIKYNIGGEYKVIKIVGGGRLSVLSNERNASRLMFLSSYVETFSDFTPLYATGESGVRKGTPYELISFDLPVDAHYIAIQTLSYENGIDFTPQDIFYNGKSLMGTDNIMAGFYKNLLPNYNTPVKVNKTFEGRRYWGQGVAAVRDKCLGFEASKDDHSTKSIYNVYSFENISLSPMTGNHNLGHCNGVDYHNDVDTLVACVSENVDTEKAKHTCHLYLVGNTYNKISNQNELLYNDDDVVDISIRQLDGVYSGSIFFGESSDYLYIVTTESASHYYSYKRRYIYKLFLGKGSNDLTPLSDSFGTFIGDKGVGEYNGTARIINKYSFDAYVEIQGGKYVNGKILLPVNIRKEASNNTSFIMVLTIGIDGSVTILKLLSLPNNDGMGNTQNTESEDIVVYGNSIYQQMIIHADNIAYKLFEYSSVI